MQEPKRYHYPLTMDGFNCWLRDWELWFDWWKDSKDYMPFMGEE